MEDLEVAIPAVELNSNRLREEKFDRIFIAATKAPQF